MQVPKMSPSYLQQLQQVSLLFLILALESAFIPSAEGDVYAKVGENFTLQFPGGPNKTLDFLYLQYFMSDSKINPNDKIFVNGFYRDRDVKNVVHPRFRDRTSFNRSLLTVTIWGIRVSDGGHYEWKHQGTSTESYTQLHVSANYKTPTLRVISCWSASSHQEGGFGDSGDRDISHLSDRDIRDSGCMLECTSHGGYPSRKVEWFGPVTRNATQFKTINNSQEEDPDTLLFNSSSIVWVSCSMGQQSLSCSVGGSTPVYLNVCESKRNDTAPPSWVIIVLAVVGLLGVIAVVCCVVQKRKRRTDSGRSSVALEREDGDYKDTILLNENSTEKGT